MSEASASIPPDAEERSQHILLEAVRLFGLDDGARFMTTRNFTLGGRTPAELTLTREGARQVRNELAVQEHGGPI